MDGVSEAQVEKMIVDFSSESEDEIQINQSVYIDDSCQICGGKEINDMMECK